VCKSLEAKNFDFGFAGFTGCRCDSWCDRFTFDDFALSVDTRGGMTEVGNIWREEELDGLDIADAASPCEVSETKAGIRSKSLDTGPILPCSKALSIPATKLG
jgi:hypothetical protein